jgi:hypothetical protein
MYGIHPVDFIGDYVWKRELEMESLRRHLIYAFRQFRRQPAMAATVILTLGLAVGASTAIFSFVNALLIRPFPFRDAEQLVEIRSVRGGQLGKLSMVEIVDIREQITVLASAKTISK